MGFLLGLRRFKETDIYIFMVRNTYIEICGEEAKCYSYLRPFNMMPEEGLIPVYDLEVPHGTTFVVHDMQPFKTQAEETLKMIEELEDANSTLENFQFP